MRMDNEIAFLELFNGSNSIVAALSLTIHYPSWIAIFFLNFSIPPPPPKLRTFSPLFLHELSELSFHEYRGEDTVEDVS